MQSVIVNLQNRRKLMFYIIIGIMLLAVLADALFDMHAVDYFEYQTQRLMIFGLMAYKVVELFLLYLFFYHRHKVKCCGEDADAELRSRFEKNGKRFFMLVPHGNVIFGLISYKLSGELLFFLVFLLFALFTLLLVKPK